MSLFMMRAALATALISAGIFPAAAGDKIVIAHRGACGYVPEHTLEAYAMAHAMGADYIEQDLVMTKDHALIVLHDIQLDETTDAPARFPDRKRADGHWYAADFTLAEIKTLSAHERTNTRFPKDKSHFEVPTFEEAIELIQGLNKTTGREAGLYPEIKQAAFHRKEGLPIEEKVLEVLAAYGYKGKDAKVYLQCFEPDCLKRIRNDFGSSFPLIQLVSGGKVQQDLHTQEGLRGIASYANGIGPDKAIIEKNPEYVAWAHELQLLVHPYTVRKDDLPAKYPDMNSELKQLYGSYDVDGLFTDFTDIAVSFLHANGLR